MLILAKAAALLLAFVAVVVNILLAIFLLGVTTGIAIALTARGLMRNLTGY